jgi:hypothetical protein
MTEDGRRLQLGGGVVDVHTAFSMNAEVEEIPESDTRVDENEVEEIVESIQAAQYFDASSMAPLTPSASVSLSYGLDGMYLMRRRQLLPD